MDQVNQMAGNATAIDSMLIEGASGPREALFIHTIERFRAQEGFAERPVCLVKAQAGLVANLVGRFANVHEEDACRWEGPGVVLATTGEPAIYVHANIACAGMACEGEGGGTYGNLGAEGYGYRLRRTHEGWIIESLGISWIS